jgi:hypothetical protein
MAFKTKITDIAQCPKCGSTHGYRLLDIARRYFCFTFCGEPDGATEPQTVKEGKIAYCAECGEAIASADGHSNRMGSAS